MRWAAGRNDQLVRWPSFFCSKFIFVYLAILGSCLRAQVGVFTTTRQLNRKVYNYQQHWKCTRHNEVCKRRAYMSRVWRALVNPVKYEKTTYFTLLPFNKELVFKHIRKECCVAVRSWWLEILNSVTGILNFAIFRSKSNNGYLFKCSFKLGGNNAPLACLHGESICQRSRWCICTLGRMSEFLSYTGRAVWIHASVLLAGSWSSRIKSGDSSSDKMK